MTVSKTTTTQYFAQELAKQNAAYEIAARLLATFPDAQHLFTETGLAEILRKILDKHFPDTNELQKEAAAFLFKSLDKGLSDREKENARLREALEKISALKAGPCRGSNLERCETCIARAALNSPNY